MIGRFKFSTLKSRKHENLMLSGTNAEVFPTEEVITYAIKQMDYQIIK